MRGSAVRGSVVRGFVVRGCVASNEAHTAQPALLTKPVTPTHTHPQVSGPPLREGGQAPAQAQAPGKVCGERCADQGTGGAGMLLRLRGTAARTDSIARA